VLEKEIKNWKFSELNQII